MKRFLSLFTVCVVLSMTTGCIGSFGLTKKVHTWNKSFDNKWAQEGTFLACLFLPVYGFATLGDIIIFNSMEFWGMDNPMASTTVGEKDQKVVLQKQIDGSILVKGQDKAVVLTQTDDGVVASDTLGNVQYKATYSEPHVAVVYDQNGNLVSKVPYQK